VTVIELLEGITVGRFIFYSFLPFIIFSTAAITYRIITLRHKIKIALWNYWTSAENKNYTVVTVKKRLIDEES
jgi:hypothetical protein